MKGIGKIKGSSSVSVWLLAAVTVLILLGGCAKEREGGEIVPTSNPVDYDDSGASGGNVDYGPDDLAGSTLPQDGGTQAAIDALNQIPVEDATQQQAVQSATGGLESMGQFFGMLAQLDSEARAQAADRRYDLLQRDFAEIARKLEAARFSEIAALFWDFSRKQNVYRLKHPRTPRRILTSDLPEFAQLVAKGFKYEGLAFRIFREQWRPITYRETLEPVTTKALFRCRATIPAGAIIYGNDSTCGGKGTSGVRLGYVASQPNRFSPVALHWLAHPRTKDQLLTAGDVEFTLLTTQARNRWRILGVQGYAAY